MDDQPMLLLRENSRGGVTEWIGDTADQNADGRERYRYRLMRIWNQGQDFYDLKSSGFDQRQKTL